LKRLNARTKSTVKFRFCAFAHGDSRFCEPLPLLVVQRKTYLDIMSVFD
jgi:hypothetical protein